MEERKKNDIYREIGQEVINSRFELAAVKQSGVRIVYSDRARKKNGKKIYAECRKVKRNEKRCNPYDYEIIVYEPNVQQFSGEQLEILMFPEFLHIEIGENANGEETAGEKK